MTRMQVSMLLFLLFIVLWIALRMLRQQKGAFIRPIAAFAALPSQIGRAVESGQTLHISLGAGGIGGHDTVTSMTGLATLTQLAEQGIATDTPPLVTVSDPSLLPLAQQALRSAYARQGVLKEYHPTQVRLVSPSPIGYAAGTMDILNHEPVSTNVMLGAFGPHAALITQAGNNKGLVQIAGTDNPQALAVFFASTDRLAIGEELYAANAYLDYQPSRLATLAVEDNIRALLVLVIIIAGIFKLFGA